MILATHWAGDHIAMVRAAHRLPGDGPDAPENKYFLDIVVQDGVTKEPRKVTIECKGENHALQLFAAYLVADEPECIYGALEELRNSPARFTLP